LPLCAPADDLAPNALRAASLLAAPVHIDIAKVRTGEGKLYLYVAIDRTSKFASVHPLTVTSAIAEVLGLAWRLPEGLGNKFSASYGDL